MLNGYWNRSYANHDPFVFVLETNNDAVSVETTLNRSFTSTWRKDFRKDREYFKGWSVDGCSLSNTERAKLERSFYYYYFFLSFANRPIFLTDTNNFRGKTYKPTESRMERIWKKKKTSFIFYNTYVVQDNHLPRSTRGYLCCLN